VHGSNCQSPYYLEHRDGKQFTQPQYDRFRDVMYGVFSTCNLNGLAPRRWGSVDDDSWTRIKNRVYLEYPMLRYCEDDWKLHRWCTAHYPRWQHGYYEERQAKKKARRSKNKTTTTTTTTKDTKATIEEEVADDYEQEYDDDDERVHKTAPSKAVLSPNTEPPG
jgi:hypothetical protein